MKRVNLELTKYKIAFCQRNHKATLKRFVINSKIKYNHTMMSNRTHKKLLSI